MVERTRIGGDKAIAISSRLIPREEAPLVASAIASAFLTTLLVGWILVVATVVISTVVTRSAVVVVVSTVVARGTIVGVVSSVGGSVVVGVVSAVGGSVVVIASTVVVVVSTGTTNSEIYGVIDGPSLSNGHNNTLMVRSSGYGREPVCTSGKASGNVSSELSVDSSVIETLEEGEDAWIRGLCRGKGRNRFNNDVVVSDDLPGVVQLLRSGEVGGLGVSEGTRLHSLRIQDNSERGVGIDVAAIWRELEFAGRHIVDTRNVTHRRRIARATLNLQTVCDSLADAEVDEVVSADKGICFASSIGVTVDILNDGGVQSKGSLRISGIITTVLVVRISSVVVSTIVSAVLVIVVAAVLVATFHTVVATEFVLTSQKTMRLWNNKGGRKLGHGKEHKRKPEVLHDCRADGMKIRNVGGMGATVWVRSKLLCRKGCG